MKSDYKIIKEEHLHTSDEKIKFCGYGEWVEELDLVIIEYLGYEAEIRRIIIREPYCNVEAYFGGHLCGFVKIPKEHPLFNNSVNLDCHGGITFDECKKDHWVGFDCGHSGDLVPTIALSKKQRQEAGKLDIFPIPEEFKQYAIFNPVYRNIQYCIDNLIEMIDQLVNVKSENVNNGK